MIRSLVTRRSRLAGLFTLVLLGVTAACGGNDAGTGGAPGTGGAGGGTGGGGGDLPPPVCDASAAPWAAGSQAFVEATDAWGLAGVEGVRLNTVDFDGDGWADLIVRRGTDVADDLFAADPCCATQSCGMGVVCPVRRTWLLRNNQMGGFEDVTVSSGLLANRVSADPDHGRPGSVFAFGDVDNDGDLDVYVGKASQTDPPSSETSELLLNDGGTFSLGPDGSALRVFNVDAPSGAAFVDVDLDGILDLFVSQNTVNGNPMQDKLYRGQGDGFFADFTATAGITTAAWQFLGDLNEGKAHTVGWSAAACDLNDDGLPELLAASYGRSPNHLWQNAGGGTFALRGVASGYAFDQRVDWTDNESARCWCTLHPTDEDCAGVPAPMYIACNTDADAFRWNHATDRNPYRLGGNSGATVCADVDNDGDLDLLTTEIVHWDVGTSSDPSELLLNTGEGDVRFERPGNDVTGLTRSHDIVSWNDGDITGAVFDFDNDAWPDVYVGSTDYPGAKGLLYHGKGNGTFEPVPFADGIDHNRSHGIAVADFDHDGDLDVVVGHSRARCSGETDCYPTSQVRFFRNEHGAGKNWLQLHLVGGPGTNRAAIGARVTVTGEDGVTQTQEVGGGHGHYGAQHDLTLHFGLGAACRAQVTVRWPNASLTTQTVELVSGYRFLLAEGEAPVVE
ncbi:MAG: CRTAC1 family protein [Myxococcales bacterium]|nr:CRTAC1 family protein [Myxococcales bacterium]